MRIGKANLKVRGMAAALAVAVLVVALAGCGGGGDDDGPETVASITPADASSYAGVELRPDGAEKTAIDGFVDAVGGAEYPRVILDAAFAHAPAGKQSQKADSAQLDITQDVEPWLGETGGAFTVGSGEHPPALIALQAEDADAAKAALQEHCGDAQTGTYEGVDHFASAAGDACGVIGGFAVLGSRKAFEAAVDVSNGEAEPLAESQDFKDATADLPDNSLATIITNTADLVAGQADARGLPADLTRKLAPKLGLDETIAASVVPGDKNLTVDLGGLPGGVGDAPSKLISGLPADAWFAVGLDELGGKINALLKTLGDAGIPGVTPDTINAVVADRAGIDLQEDLSSWLGGAALFVRGEDSASLEGALVLESTDDAAAARAMNELRESVPAQQGTSAQPLELGSGGNGFTIDDPDVEQPVNFVQQNGKFVIGVGDIATQEAINPPRTLAQAPQYTAASGSIGGGGPEFFLSIPKAISVLGDPDPLADPALAGLSPLSLLKGLEYLTAGGSDRGLKIVFGAK
jgi:hypothetical protein